MNKFKNKVKPNTESGNIETVHTLATLGTLSESKQQDVQTLNSER